ncbi:MAG: hypothetical protein IPK80_33880 [Nannocystis sp.]|nr:hypothetical protein [Nannocystis sp.]
MVTLRPILRFAVGTALLGSSACTNAGVEIQPSTNPAPPLQPATPSPEATPTDPPRVDEAAEAPEDYIVNTPPPLQPEPEPELQPQPLPRPVNVNTPPPRDPAELPSNNDRVRPPPPT